MLTLHECREQEAILMGLIGEDLIGLHLAALALDAFIERTKLVSESYQSATVRDLLHLRAYSDYLNQLNEIAERDPGIE